VADEQRIMVVSHGHPARSPGGGENAAYALFQGLQQRHGVNALFAYREPPTQTDRDVLSPLTANVTEVALRSETEGFRHSQRHHELIHRDFRRLLEWFRPSVVHFHHYMHLGLELLREVRAWSPDAHIALTLHEFLAMCHHDGQMVKTYDGSLCERADPDACNRCFPYIAPEDFLLRELFIKSLLAHVDGFVSPSEFLIGRYVSWGLPVERFTFIENGVPHVDGHGLVREAASGRRFGFFGQIWPTKGLHVLLEAMSFLPAELRTGPAPITLDVHGSGLSQRRADYQNLISDRLRKVKDRVTMHGPYVPAHVSVLMRGVDWIIVPSTWWENSPLVIQEAFASGIPVICSGIGGMAEKVSDGINGLHFRVGDARHLADRMVEAATTPGLLERLRAAIPSPPTRTAMVDEHLALYVRLEARRQAATIDARS
jgi:glycosyltransferase involved in cell wall biosynthesis